jgi:hypothetical protein
MNLSPSPHLPFAVPPSLQLVSSTCSIYRLETRTVACSQHSLTFNPSTFAVPNLQKLVYNTCSISCRKDVIGAVLPDARGKGLRLARAFPEWPHRGLPTFAEGKLHATLKRLLRTTFLHQAQKREVEESTVAAPVYLHLTQASMLERQTVFLMVSRLLGCVVPSLVPSMRPDFCCPGTAAYGKRSRTVTAAKKPDVVLSDSKQKLLRQMGQVYDSKQQEVCKQF